MFRRAGAHIVSESIQGEVIIVNLLQGVYYSITGSGPQIWECICNGYSIEKIAELLRTEFLNVPEDVTDKITNFAAKLAEDSLIQHCEGDPQPIDQPVVSEPSNGVRKQFEEPAISKFNDMEEVLILDPVHDFDESGWPNQGKEAAKQA
jgi:hypothetical protein